MINHHTEAEFGLVLCQILGAESWADSDGHFSRWVLQFPKAFVREDPLFHQVAVSPGSKDGRANGTRQKILNG